MTAQSTIEFENIVFTSAVNRAIWLRKMMKDLDYEQTEATKITCDSSSEVLFSKNQVFHGRTKHINIKFHFIREVQQSNEVLLVHCSSENQLADIFNKSLPKERFEDLRQRNWCLPQKCQGGVLDHLHFSSLLFLLFLLISV